MVLDALTRREWVKEDLLAGELGLHPNQVYGSYGGTTTSTLAVMELASSDASDHFQGTRLNNVMTAAIELKLKESKKSNM